jgi:hypothetical protein
MDWPFGSTTDPDTSKPNEAGERSVRSAPRAITRHIRDGILDFGFWILDLTTEMRIMLVIEQESLVRDCRDLRKIPAPETSPA